MPYELVFNMFTAVDDWTGDPLEEVQAALNAYVYRSRSAASWKAIAARVIRTQHWTKDEGTFTPLALYIGALAEPDTEVHSHIEQWIHDIDKYFWWDLNKVFDQINKAITVDVTTLVSIRFIQEPSEELNQLALPVAEQFAVETGKSISHGNVVITPPKTRIQNYVTEVTFPFSVPQSVQRLNAGASS